MHAEDWYEDFYRVESPPTLFGKPEDQVVKATIDTIGQYFIRLWLLKTPKLPKRVLGWAAIVSPAWSPDELSGIARGSNVGRLIRSATFEGDLPSCAMNDIATDVAADPKKVSQLAPVAPSDPNAH